MKKLLFLFASVLFISCGKSLFKQKQQTIKFKYDGHLKIKLKPENYDKGNFFLIPVVLGWFLQIVIMKNKKCLLKIPIVLQWEESEMMKLKHLEF